MLRPVAGETTARVTPAARLTAIALASGLIAGATSIAALNGEVAAWVSLVASTASTSTRPIREKPAMTPVVTHLPRASTTCAPAGTGTFAPAATTRPSRMTTVPPSIGSEPSPMTTRPPVIAMVWAFAERAAKIPARRLKQAKEANGFWLLIRSHLISRLPRRAGRARSR